MAKRKGLYKTVIVIWSKDNPQDKCELSDLAREAEEGSAYCSKFRAELIKDPKGDPDWDGTEFFDEGF